MDQNAGSSDLIKEIAARSGIAELFREYVITEACRRGGMQPGAVPTAVDVKRALPEISRPISRYVGAQEGAKRLDDISRLLAQR